MVVYGGMTSKNVPTSEMHILDVKLWNWTTPHITKGKVPAMAFPSGTMSAGAVYVFGGQSKDDKTLDSFIKIDLDALECMTVKLPTPYRGRHRHTFTQVKGIDMIIFGGFDGIKVTNDTYILKGSNVVEAPLSATKPKKTNMAAQLGFDVLTSVPKPGQSEDGKDGEDYSGGGGGGGGGGLFGAMTSRTGIGRMFGAGAGADNRAGTAEAVKVGAQAAKAEMMDEMNAMREQYGAELTLARGDIAKLVVTMEIMKREMAGMREELDAIKHDNQKLKAHARRSSVQG